MAHKCIHAQNTHGALSDTPRLSRYRISYLTDSVPPQHSAHFEEYNYLILPPSMTTHRHYLEPLLSQSTRIQTLPVLIASYLVRQNNQWSPRTIEPREIADRRRCSPMSSFTAP